MPQSAAPGFRRQAADVVLYLKRSASLLAIDFRTVLDELDRLDFHPLLQRGDLRNTLCGGIFADFLRDLHRTEMHHLGRILGQGFVMEFTRLVRTETDVELIFQAEFEARFRQRIVSNLRARMALGQMGCVGGDLVGDDAILDIDLVPQAEMLLRPDVTQHRHAIPADGDSPDARGDVVVACRDVGGQWSQCVERRFVSLLQLQVHIFFDQVHRHAARAFDHYLNVVFPGDLGQLAQGFQFNELRFVIGIVDRTRAQAIAKAEADIVGFHDVADIFEMIVKERFAGCARHHLAMIEPPRLTIPVRRLAVIGTYYKRTPAWVMR